jgi:hypothetical protein
VRRASTGENGENDENDDENLGWEPCRPAQGQWLGRFR